MSEPVPSAEASLRFLQEVQVLLEEGLFVSTYKFALLQALADLAVEKGDVGGAGLTLQSDEIAEKFIEYYWRQVAEFPTPCGGRNVLTFARGRQAAIVNQVRQMRDQAESLPRAKTDGASWQKLVRDVARTVRNMPLWKLQTIRSGKRPFLYANTGRGTCIELFPGVAYHLRVFHGQIQAMVQGEWVRWVRSLRQNASTLGQITDLQEFMFDTERRSLGVYTPLLQKLQAGRCFYCGGGLSGRGEVDHFIPWVRYPLDLGHNFVLAHGACNNDKRDTLASVLHLENWILRNRSQVSRMQAYFGEHALPADLPTTESVAVWAYEQTERNGGSVWGGKGKQLMGLNSVWRRCF